MAQIRSLKLLNFKGAGSVEIALSHRADCPVVTLIGLNESGKTTILEGLSYSFTGDNLVRSLFEAVSSNFDATALVPLHRKAAFTGTVSIGTEIRLDAVDRTGLLELVDKKGYELDPSSLKDDLEASADYVFQDSDLVESLVTMDLEFRARRKSGRSRKWQDFAGPSEGQDDIWSEVLDEIQRRVPRVAYFPTFLVEMPAKIYLQEHPGERPVNRHYRAVLQDILDSLDEGLKLDKHVVNRIRDFQVRDASASWFSRFFSGPSRSPVDSVFQKISNAVTKEVLGSWKRVFQRPISAKSVSVEWNIDSENGNLPYASFVVSDGESRYAINERSLGFRWFFSFLLFTAFKQSSGRQTVFIFDEPAANLHAKAQAELLSSFSKIVQAGDRIIYSTHSHHMININWLAGAYIVENLALDYDADDSFDLSAKPTQIKVTPYREFVASYPSRTSYFQPVVEKLEYVTPEVLGQSPFLILEGITDFYAFRLVQRITGVGLELAICPGAGAGASGPLVAFLMGRGESFVLLVDDDRAGQRAVNKYREEWFLSPSVAFSLGDLDSSYKGMQLEGLLCDETKQLAAQHFGVEQASKKQLGLYLAEMLAQSAGRGCLGTETIRRISGILKMVAAEK